MYKELHFSHDGVDYAVMVKIDNKKLADTTKSRYMGTPVMCRMFNLTQVRGHSKPEKPEV